MYEEKTKTLIVMSFFVTAGAMVSISTPDLDQTRGIFWRANIIQHRSLITHSAILCWILFQVANRINMPQTFRKWVRYFAAGTGVGLSVHLSFDLFPMAWKGYALIHIPLVGNLNWIPFDGDLAPVIFSFTWLFANMTYCWHLIAKLGLNRMLWVICVSTTIAFFLIEAQSERTFWGPLIILSAGILGTFRPDITHSVLMSARTFFKREK